MKRYHFSSTCSLALMLLSASLALGCKKDPQKDPQPSARYMMGEEAKIGSGAQMTMQVDTVELDVPKGGTVGNLSFEAPCHLTLVRKDGTLLAEKEGVVAKQNGASTWSSRKVVLENKAVFAFFSDE